ncbi:MAG: hemolysin family protein [Acidobacteriota bacterium]|nr:hemolysin family protein [Acidobacteriota bacterium]
MVIRFIVLLLILGANAFFAAAEVALVSVRQSRIRELAAEGHAGAQSALSLLENPGRLLSVTQVGVTLASLGVGWAGEDTMYRLLRGVLDPLHLQAPAAPIHAAAFLVAFLSISYCHVIIGEVVPKNLAIQKADRLAVLVAPALLLFYRLSRPFVYVIERTTALTLRALGISASDAKGGHTPEELKYIIRAIRHEGRLQQFEEDAIQHLIELADYNAREIMTPRHNIVSLPVDAELDQVLETITEHQFTRLPVYDGRPEHIIGIAHYKDLMRVWEERRFAYDRRRPSRPFRLRRFIRKPFVIPETKPLNQLIGKFRANHTRMALVVDEFGTVSGLVTLEDVLEQIFGDIGDEHDAVEPSPASGEHVLQLEGATTIRDLENRYGIELPADAGFDTLAGFLLLQFGQIPKEGNAVDFQGRHFTIAQMERNRIASVVIEKLDAKQQANLPHEA